MPAATNGDAQVLLAGTIDRGHDVIGSGAACDFVWLAPVHRVEDRASSGATARLYRLCGHELSSLLGVGADPLSSGTLGCVSRVTNVELVYRDHPALSLRGLTKRYGDGTLALEDFDLEIPAGAFFGLLGPNGAGKTTLISAVCNLLRVTDGSISVFGEPHDSLEARSWVGLAEQDINLDRFLTVRETLTYHGGYWGMREPEERADELIDAFGLTHKRDTRAPRLSGGQRRRLLLARALMHRPRLVILDEPTAGVDFELRQELWRYIRRLHAEGTTILLTTHYLEEAEELCDEIGLIRDGHLIARDNAQGLREDFGVERLQDVYVKAMAL